MSVSPSLGEEIRTIGSGVGVKRDRASSLYKGRKWYEPLSNTSQTFPDEAVVLPQSSGV